MAYTGRLTAGNEDGNRPLDAMDATRPVQGLGPKFGTSMGQTPTLKLSSKLFKAKNPGAAGKLGKSSTLAESLSKLRGKGALA